MILDCKFTRINDKIKIYQSARCVGKSIPLRHAIGRDERREDEKGKMTRNNDLNGGLREIRG
jgi:hypothetical protein